LDNREKSVMKNFSFSKNDMAPNLDQSFENGDSVFGRIFKGVRSIRPLFASIVIAPTIFSILYLFFLASDVYISESKYLIRSPEKPMSSGLGVLLSTAGFNRADDEGYAAKAYVESRDSLKDLNSDGYIARVYGSTEYSAFNRFNPFGWDGSFEALYKFYQAKVNVVEDATSSMMTLTVKAFSPEDAHRINGFLLQRSEALVNQLNERGRKDLIAYAQREVDDAKIAARNASVAMSRFRNREGVVDPEKQATVQLQMVSKLQDQLIATRLHLQQIEKYTPDNPQIPILRTQMRNLDEQVRSESAKVAGGSRSLAANAVEYERLKLDGEFSAKQLAVAMTALEEAKNEARRKQAYIERVVQPSLPDKPGEPRRLRGVLTTFVVGLIVWGVLTMLIAGVREHSE
jgi:capsular polysaccharide transport system permease protein